MEDEVLAAYDERTTCESPAHYAQQMLTMEATVRELPVQAAARRIESLALASRIKEQAPAP